MPRIWKPNMSFEELMARAEAAARSGRMERLERLAVAALEIEPGELRPKLLLGVALCAPETSG